MEWVFTREQLAETATALWNFTKDAPVLAFHGAMGSGKTTLIHALCDAGGVKDVVSSPTFGIINEYAYHTDGTTKKLFHIDLYRVKSEEEARQAGVEDCLYSNARCFVEWPEKAPALLPENTMHIYIKVVNEDTRRLRIGNN